ncbi:hypothetical protein CGRA01v4_10148 [Colletotrichum graminicola]|nr:hypothetical protein CGRA01v4_10148 [Colletotrichum graminicola]
MPTVSSSSPNFSLLAWVDHGPLAQPTLYSLLFSFLSSYGQLPRTLEFGLMITPRHYYSHHSTPDETTHWTPTYTTEKGGQSSIFDACPFGRIRGRTALRCLLSDECCPWTSSKSRVITPHDSATQEPSPNDGNGHGRTRPNAASPLYLPPRHGPRQWLSTRWLSPHHRSATSKSGCEMQDSTMIALHLRCCLDAIRLNPQT